MRVKWFEKEFGECCTWLCSLDARTFLVSHTLIIKPPPLELTCWEALVHSSPLLFIRRFAEFILVRISNRLNLIMIRYEICLAVKNNFGSFGSGNSSAKMKTLRPWNEINLTSNEWTWKGCYVWHSSSHIWAKCYTSSYHIMFTRNLSKRYKKLFVASISTSFLLSRPPCMLFSLTSSSFHISHIHSVLQFKLAFYVNWEVLRKCFSQIPTAAAAAAGFLHIKFSSQFKYEILSAHI